MAIVENWLPPTRENWETLLFCWEIWPLLASLQWLVSWYPMGKTSYPSIFNFPGRLGWFLMEIPGAATLLYHMAVLPALAGSTAGHGGQLPWQNKVLAALFVIHYSYRAVLYPYMAPSMAPIGIPVMAMAACFQVANATAIGAWLAAYGPTTAREWEEALGAGGNAQFALGVALFFAGLASNYYHDEALREIRRKEERRQRSRGKGSVYYKDKEEEDDEDDEKKNAGGADGMSRRRSSTSSTSSSDSSGRHYEVPRAGLFSVVLYPHYLLEWVEWFGYWMACGWACTPAMLFLVNEVASMLPRAVRGRAWYLERFGEEKIGKRRAVIPGLL